MRTSTRGASIFISLMPPPPRSTLFPYTTLFRSLGGVLDVGLGVGDVRLEGLGELLLELLAVVVGELLDVDVQRVRPEVVLRSEEHTSELQSQSNLVCRLLLEKTNNNELAPRLAA